MFDRPTGCKVSAIEIDEVLPTIRVDELN